MAEQHLQQQRSRAQQQQQQRRERVGKHRDRAATDTRMREEQWNMYVGRGYEEYNSGKDRMCPRAVMRRYNRWQRKRAEEEEVTQYVHTTALLEPGGFQTESYTPDASALPTVEDDDAPNRYTLDMIESAASRMVSFQQGTSSHELEILQKVLLREKLIKDLQSLAVEHLNLNAVQDDVSQYIRAIRSESVDLVERIQRWKAAQTSFTPAYIFRGVNYLVTMCHDLDFLHEIKQLKEWTDIPLRNNPFLIREPLTANELRAEDYGNKKRTHRQRRRRKQKEQQRQEKEVKASRSALMGFGRTGASTGAGTGNDNDDDDGVDQDLAEEERQRRIRKLRGEEETSERPPLVTPVVIDGIDMLRIRDAEKVLLREEQINRSNRERTSSSHPGIGHSLMRGAMSNLSMHVDKVETFKKKYHRPPFPAHPLADEPPSAKGPTVGERERLADTAANTFPPQPEAPLPVLPLPGNPEIDMAVSLAMTVTPNTKLGVHVEGETPRNNECGDANFGGNDGGAPHVDGPNPYTPDPVKIREEQERTLAREKLASRNLQRELRASQYANPAPATKPRAAAKRRAQRLSTEITAHTALLREKEDELLQTAADLHDAQQRLKRFQALEQKATLKGFKKKAHNYAVEAAMQKDTVKELDKLVKVLRADVFKEKLEVKRRHQVLARVRDEIASSRAATESAELENDADRLGSNDTAARHESAAPANRTTASTATEHHDHEKEDAVPVPQVPPPAIKPPSPQDAPVAVDAADTIAKTQDSSNHGAEEVKDGT